MIEEPEATIFLEFLSEALLRYDAVGIPRELVRDWHFVQYGAAILDDEQDFGVEDAHEKNATGTRWVIMTFTMRTIKLILLKLKLYLEGLQRSPKIVLFFDDRDSEIIGRTIGILLNIPAHTYSASSNCSDSLIVAFDNSFFNGIEELWELDVNQTVFALNLNWLEYAYLTADVAGILAQHCFLPWHKGAPRVKDVQKKLIEENPGDDRNPVEIAEELASYDADVDEYFDDTLDFYIKYQRYLKGGTSGGTKRRWFRPDSPVSGNFYIA